MGKLLLLLLGCAVQVGAHFYIFHLHSYTFVFPSAFMQTYQTCLLELTVLLEDFVPFYFQRCI